MPLVVLLLLCIPHKLCARLEIQGDQLQIEAWYDNDLPADNCKVILYRGDTKLGEASTDERGLCKLPVPAAGSYRIDVNAGGGHRTEQLFEIAAEPVVIAGESREGTQRKRWLGMLTGICIIVICTVLGRRWLKTEPAAVAAPGSPPPPASPE